MTKDYALLPVVNSDKKIIIDKELYPLLSKYPWYINQHLSGKTERPVTRYRLSGKQKSHTLARVLKKAPRGMYPRHKNGNTLDCRRDNIELVDNKAKAGVNYVEDPVTEEALISYMGPQHYET